MTYIDYDDISQDLVLDEKEMEGIKTEQILNILRPKIEKYLTYNDLEFNCTFMLNLYSYAEEIGFDNTIGCLFPLIQELTFKKDIKNNAPGFRSILLPLQAMNPFCVISVSGAITAAPVFDCMCEKRAEASYLCSIYRLYPSE